MKPVKEREKVEVANAMSEMQCEVTDTNIRLFDFDKC